MPRVVSPVSRQHAAPPRPLASRGGPIPLPDVPEPTAHAPPRPAPGAPLLCSLTRALLAAAHGRREDHTSSPLFPHNARGVGPPPPGTGRGRGNRRPSCRPRPPPRGLHDHATPRLGIFASRTRRRCGYAAVCRGPGRPTTPMCGGRAGWRRGAGHHHLVAAAGARAPATRRPPPVLARAIFSWPPASPFPLLLLLLLPQRSLPRPALHHPPPSRASPPPSPRGCSHRVAAGARYIWHSHSCTLSSLALRLRKCSSIGAVRGRGAPIPEMLQFDCFLVSGLDCSRRVGGFWDWIFFSATMSIVSQSVIPRTVS
jgi:hypothetical protein